MQQHVTYLVVEDNPEWSRAISGAIRRYFEDERRFPKARVREDSAYDGDQGWQRLRSNKYDLVTLDMNLSEGPGKSKTNGLDLLGAIAEGNRAFFVLMITGAVNDQALEALYGPATAALMSYGAMLGTVKKLPGDRVGYLQKPSGVDVNAAMAVLAPLLQAQLDQYCEMSRERNIFRPMPGNKSFWEVRYDGGLRRPVQDSQPLELIRRALANPDREMKIIELMQSIARNSRVAVPIQLDDAKDRSEDAPPEAFDASVAADWETSEFEGLQITDSPPVDTIEGPLPIEALIRALLNCAVRGITLDEFIKQCDETMGVTTAFFSVPAKIREYIGRPAAQEEFGDQSHRLPRLLVELNPALDRLQARLAQEPAPAREPGTKKVRVALGVDTQEMRLARKHFARALDYLRRDDELGDFVDHLEKHIGRGDKAKGRLHYSPVDGSDLLPFWLTD